MPEKNPKRKKIYKRLKSNYRLVVMNDDTFEEKLSITLTPLNVFTWGGASFILIVGLTISLIAFTGLREYIPGYTDLTVKKQATYAAIKADSLENVMKQKDLFIRNIAGVITGEPFIGEQSEGTSNKSAYANITIKPSREDSLMRSEIENNEQYNVVRQENASNSRGLNSYFFFAPLTGVLSNGFNPKDGHYGVDIITGQNDAVKAVLDGTVILDAWTTETGHVIQIQHDNNLVSIYKHNSALLKKTGDRIKAGEAIAIVGNSGEQSTGPHLHFELWLDGKPLNPTDYFSF